MIIEKETEIKISISNVERIKEKLRAMHFISQSGEGFEFNIVFDLPGNELFKKGFLLRLRNYADKSLVTLKKPIDHQQGERKYKVRGEIEIEVSDFEKTRKILTELGFQIYFIYEKYREVFQRSALKVMVDRTPIGDFIEIEGDGADINRTTRLLGFQKKDHIADNYLTLFRKSGQTGFMQFK